jgi:hypothetical protein
MILAPLGQSALELLAMGKVTLSNKILHIATHLPPF